MNVAVIDLGSNTFHLLIVEINKEKPFREVYRKREFTALCEGGIDHLRQTSIETGLKACRFFNTMMKEFQVEHALITGTAALRFAVNADDFILPAEEIFGQKLDIINGQEEAELIFDGIRLLHEMKEATLIMDIGGGSTEFIIAKEGQIQWKHSFKLGVGVMYADYHRSEPIEEKDETALRLHIRNELIDLKQKLHENNILTMIGASGSFEVLESMSGLNIEKDIAHEITIQNSTNIIQSIIKADYLKRQSMDGLPQDRVKYIVVAMILIDEVLHLAKPKKIIVSPYALKEGLIVKLMNKLLG